MDDKKSKYKINSIMITKNELNRKTDEFIKLIEPLHKMIIRKNKNQTKEEDKAMKAIKNIFDENQQLKIKLNDMRKEKKEIINKLKNEKSKIIHNDLDNKRKQLQQTIKEENKKQKFNKLTKNQTHQYENIEYEYKKDKTAFNDLSTTWFIRQKIINARKKKRYHDIVFYDDEDKKEKFNAKKSDFSVILNEMIPKRQEIIEKELDRLKGITINEKLLCIFRKWFPDEQEVVWSRSVKGKFFLRLRLEKICLWPFFPGLKYGFGRCL